jgi:hypothetical protein
VPTILKQRGQQDNFGSDSWFSAIVYVGYFCPTQTGGSEMSNVAPFPSKKPGTKVYHDNKKCTEGNNIERHYLAAGTGGHSKCDHCKGLA